MRLPIQRRFGRFDLLRFRSLVAPSDAIYSNLGLNILDVKHSRLLLLARMANTREDLEEVLVRIDDSMMDWAPVAGMRTVSGQMLEIAATEIQVRGRLKRAAWVSDDEVRTQIGDLGSIEKMRAFLRDVRSETIAQIEELSDEELEADAGYRLGAGGYPVD